MLDEIAKTEKWLNNLSDLAIRQALRFILNTNSMRETCDNIGFIKLQIEEFSRMYPEFDPDKYVGIHGDIYTILRDGEQKNG